MSADVPRRRGPALALAALVGACALAIAGQYVLTPLGALRLYMPGEPAAAPIGFVLLGLAGVVAAFAVLVSEREDPPSDSAAPATPELPFTPMVVSVVCVAAATLTVYIDIDNPWAIYVWALGLSSLIWGGLGAGTLGRARRQSAWSVAEIVGVAAITAVGFWLRYGDLLGLPAEVHGDEAACGIEARRVLRGSVPNLLSVGWYDIPYLSFALSAGAMRIFGDDLFGLRMASVVQGVASIPVLYALIRRLFTVRIAALSAAWLALSHWHIHFSRIGTDYLQASFAALLTLWLLVRADRGGRAIDWIGAGLCLGFALSVYPAGRVTVVVVAVYLISERWRDAGNVRHHQRGVAMLVFTALAFVAPTYAYMARLPGALSSRTQDVLVLSERNLQHTYQATETDDVPHVLALQLANSLAAFNWRGDRSMQHGHRAPLLDFWSGPIFAIGIIAFSLLALRRRYILITAWFWSSFVLGSVMTVDAMFSPRMIVAVPTIPVFIALIVDRGWRLAAEVGGTRGRGLATSVVVVFLGLSGWANYDDYFRLHASHLQPPRIATVLARYVETVNDDYRIYLLGRESLDYDTPRFLVPDADARSVGGEPLELPLLQLPAGKGAVFVVEANWPRADEVMQQIMKEYVNARLQDLRFRDGKAAFHLAIVDRLRLQN